MSRIFSYILAIPRATLRVAKNHPRSTTVVTLVVVVGLGFTLFGTDATAPEKEVTTTPTVTVASVAALSRDSAPLVVLGEVRSVTQAELRSQKSGDITRVNVKAGQYVGAGTILAEIENASERAAVLSAQGSVAAAEATLAKVRAGARTEDRVSAAAQSQSAVISLQTAQENARSAFSQAYSLAQDAVFAKADTFFSNPYTVNPSFRVHSAQLDERDALEATRVTLGTLLDGWQKKTTTMTLSTDQLNQSLIEAENNLAQIKSFLNTIGSFVSEQTINEYLSATEKSAQEATILAARSNIDAARSSIGNARSGLAAALSAAQVASLSESKIAVGERPEDIAAVEANVTQTRGALAGAVAQLEKSLIRTPIAGTVATFNVARGDFVGAQTVIAVVTNPGALEIEAFVSQAARERITVGQSVLVDGTFKGTVTTLAPGLDPVTKKARLTVGLPDEVSLVNGQYVELAILNEDNGEAQKTRNGFLIPITAIKVLPRGMIVFTVNDAGMLEAVPVTEGPIVGNSMLIQDGLTPDTRIVIDARGLAEGDHVEMAE